MKVDFLRIVCCSNEHFLCVNEPLSPMELTEHIATSCAARSASGLLESLTDPSSVANGARESRPRAPTSASVASSALSAGAAGAPDVDDMASLMGSENDAASGSFLSSLPPDPVALLRGELELSTYYRRLHPLVALLLSELVEASSFQYEPFTLTEYIRTISTRINYM